MSTRQPGDPSLPWRWIFFFFFSDLAVITAKSENKKRLWTSEKARISGSRVNKFYWHGRWRNSHFVPWKSHPHQVKSNFGICSVDGCHTYLFTIPGERVYVHVRIYTNSRSLGQLIDTLVFASLTASFKLLSDTHDHGSWLFSGTLNSW